MFGFDSGVGGGGECGGVDREGVLETSRAGQGLQVEGVAPGCVSKCLDYLGAG